MTSIERELLLFLVRAKAAELSDWDYQPSRGETRQTLSTLMEAFVREDMDRRTKEAADG